MHILMVQQQNILGDCVKVQSLSKRGVQGLQEDQANTACPSLCTPALPKMLSLRWTHTAVLKRRERVPQPVHIARPFLPSSWVIEMVPPLTSLPWVSDSALPLLVLCFTSIFLRSPTLQKIKPMGSVVRYSGLSCCLKCWPSHKSRTGYSASNPAPCQCAGKAKCLDPCHWNGNQEELLPPALGLAQYWSLQSFGEGISRWKISLTLYFSHLHVSVPLLTFSLPPLSPRLPSITLTLNE